MFALCFCFFSFYFKCSETSRDSVGHFGLNSLSHSLSLSLALSLLLSLKEAAFCDLQIEAGHVTPGGLSITGLGRPTSLLKGTAPSLHRRDNSLPSSAALTRSPLAWFFSVPHARAIIDRKGKRGEA